MRALLLTSATAPVAMAQDKVIKKAPMGQSDPSSGKAMYTSYCAPCHGASGKGDGPVASEFGMGNLFGALDPHDPVRVNQRIQTLVDYVKTLQAN